MLIGCRLYTDEYEDQFRYALLDLTPETAQRFLVWRSLYQRAEAVDDKLYCLEFWCYAPRYASGDLFDGTVNDLLDDNEDAWVAVPGYLRAPADDELRTCGDTARATDSGVLFSAAPKHGGSEFTTPTLSWEQLEAVSRGENPFGR